jgi:hypothetical protein
MKSFRPLCMSFSPELIGEKIEKGKNMNAVMGVAPASLQASAAVVGINAAVKPPMETRDDVVAPISETTNGEAAKSDLSLLKMSDPTVGQTLDVTA